METRRDHCDSFHELSGLLNPAPAPGFREPGSNGLAVDADGRLLICQQGERRVARLEKNGMQTVIAARFDGNRFNSPNDLAIRQERRRILHRSPVWPRQSQRFAP